MWIQEPVKENSWTDTICGGTQGDDEDQQPFVSRWYRRNHMGFWMGQIDHWCVGKKNPGFNLEVHWLWLHLITHLSSEFSLIKLFWMWGTNSKSTQSSWQNQNLNSNFLRSTLMNSLEAFSHAKFSAWYCISAHLAQLPWLLLPAQREEHCFFRAAISILGVPCWAEEHRPVFRCESPEEGCGSYGWWCWMYDGGEESPLFSLGAPVPDSCLLHISNQGKTRICHLPPWAEGTLQRSYSKPKLK